MIATVHPASFLVGAVRLPGDKSVAHRAALFAAIIAAVGLPSRRSDFTIIPPDVWAIVSVPVMSVI